MPGLTVIGIGNVLRGDDGVGPALIQALAEESIPDIELIQAGSDALGLLEYLENRQRVWVVDACQMGRRPGEMVIFDPSEAELIMEKVQISLHGLGLAEALKMADALKMLPPELKIIGIEPESIQFNGELSLPVQRALKKAIKLVRSDRIQSAEVA